jgi:predicted permease
MTLWQDVKFSVRLLFKRPLFTVTVVVTLALGIGANSAAFSVVNAVLLRPLPYADSDRLMVISGLNEKGAPVKLSFPRLTAFREQSQSFDGIAAVADENFILTGRDAPEQVEGGKVSGDIFRVLGVKPLVGRTFLPEEDQPGGAAVVILSHELWQRSFGSDPSIVGRSIGIDGNSVTVVGVLPQGFKFLDDKNKALWMPRANEISYLAPESVRLGAFYLRVVGRLKPGVGYEQARAELERLTGLYKQNNPGNSDLGLGSRLTPLQEFMVGDIRQTLLVVLGIVGLILLIACANVANLLLARAAARRREFTIRTALGAGRWQLMRQLLTESVMLSMLGGGLGLLLALCGVRWLVEAQPANVPRIGEVGIDVRVLAFNFGVALLTGVVFGLAPALQGSRVDLNDTLKEGGRTGSDGSGGRRMRGLLVVLEVALTLVVLVSAGLLIQSFLRLRNSSVGFDQRRVLSMVVALPKTRYPEQGQQMRFFQQVVERVKGLPGVVNVATVWRPPLGGPGNGGMVEIEGLPSPGRGKEPIIPTRFVSPGYFRTLGLPLLSGREFSEQDYEKAQKVVIINRSMAQRFWPGADPVGKYIIYSTSKVRAEVIGVVGDAKFKVSDPQAGEELYLPQSRLIMALLVRTANDDPLALAPAVREEVRGVDREQPVTEVQTLEQVIDSSVSQPRMTMLLLSTFAVVALLLSVVGVYGVMTYSVTQRTPELGVRIALGARPRNILGLVIKQGMLLVLLGILVGLAASAASARVLSSLLFEVSAFNPPLFLGVALLLSAIALLACYLPARRATRIAPVIALNNNL